ncbi:MXAN_6640 family putative metalloprotease [Nocardioides lijunqiniae]|uniref:MXAN_6640 family putative metalloprotease n=1 Tax=Nocardioides lijunqiniae TaxID=2760832 RepID=UPI0018783707|nr:MXAN_6640 family putative metalloprotease [Nocardioides lijunqiniae]
MPSLSARRAPVLVLALLAVLASLLAAPSAGAVDRDDTAAESAAEGAEDAPVEVSSPEAEQALDIAEDALEGEGDEDVDATLALRELALRLDELEGADRVTAERIFARPTSPSDDDTYGPFPVSRICSPVVCVHYVKAGPEAATDAWAAKTLATTTSVHNRYVAAGYKAPKPDGTRGGDARTDIYIANIGDRGLYGYCTTDERKPFRAPYDRYAYCVVDNNYAEAGFAANTPDENLQVTVAHEYFHAVQYAYDFAEDAWFLEATAAWIEDEVYDSVDDNRQYLAASPLRRPRLSMDRFNPNNGYHYGVWIFFRRLSERFPGTQGGLPTIVRDMWRRADGSGPARRNQYSWQAVSSVLKARGTSAQREFSTFSAANRRPRKTYSEGAAYRAAPLAGRARVSRGLVRREVRLNHLSSATYRLTPVAALRAPRWKVRVKLDLASASRGSRAVITTFFKNGTQKVQVVRPGARGNAQRAVPFSRSTVSFVEVTLVNASGRFRCWRGTAYSCQGRSRDDGQRQSLTARAFR